MRRENMSNDANEFWTLKIAAVKLDHMVEAFSDKIFNCFRFFK